jgi:hypothetical protein
VGGGEENQKQCKSLGMGKTKTMTITYAYFAAEVCAKRTRNRKRMVHFKVFCDYEYQIKFLHYEHPTRTHLVGTVYTSNMTNGTTWGGSDGIAMGWTDEVRLPAGKHFSLLHYVQIGSGSHLEYRKLLPRG